jgi:protein-S-isoprenylcysteine O-methyltransferase Ste14
MIKIFIYLSYLFGFSEIIIAFLKRSKTKSVKVRRDRGSRIILYVIITLSFIAGFFLANYRKWDSLNYFFASIGLVLILSGFIIRLVAIIQLKTAFTVDVAINKEHELKTNELYSIIRHPSYLGMILIIAGISVGMNSLLSFLIVSLPVFFAILYRIYIEEAVLTKEFGARYMEYKKTTKKIIPYIY